LEAEIEAKTGSIQIPCALRREPEDLLIMSLSRAKIVVITGVSRGLGRSMADEFARLGHIVAGCARSKQEIDRISQSHPKPHSFAAIDVSEDGAVAEWAKHVIATAGIPDLLLNNAAIINRNAPLWRVSDEEFSQVIDVNIKGVTNVIRHFLPAMLQVKKGVIVNFSSGWGRSTDAEVAPYCATKWAIEGLTRALAQELPAGMAAVPLNPGIINTAMLKSCFGGSASAYPSPEEWAKRAVPFLLSLGGQHNGEPLTAPG
jgi:NAD(P)-dependent dehydrogenase (short-subunit alcohol dehydrogenase family)